MSKLKKDITARSAVSDEGSIAATTNAATDDEIAVLVEQLMAVVTPVLRGSFDD